LIRVAWCRYERGKTLGSCVITAVSPPVLIVPDSWLTWVLDVVTRWNSGTPELICNAVQVGGPVYAWGMH